MRKHRLDDLHPGGAAHAANQDIRDHQRADDRNHEALSGAVGDTEQQCDESAGACHLGEQVEERHSERRRCRSDTDGALAHPERQDVGHRVAAGVPKQLGNEQQRDQPGDEEADAVEESVIAVDGDRAGNAEERRRGQIVTGDRDAVLRSGERVPGGVVVGRGLVVAGGADDDQRHRDEEQEDADVDDRLTEECPSALSSIFRRMSSATGSSRRFA